MPAVRNGSSEAMDRRLQRWIARERGVPEARVAIDDLRRLAGGASRLLWSFDLRIETPDGAEESAELVLRQDPPGRIAPGGLELEAELLRAAAAADVPVPRVYWSCADPEVLGSPGFAMQRIAGEAIPRRLLRDERYAEARRSMTRQLGENLARIHRIETRGTPLEARLPRPPAGVSPGRAEIDRIAQGYRASALEPHPVLDLAERWLREREPVSGRLSLVHGDYRMGNVMCDESGVRAILDWELAHLGDPVEDLGWLCVRAWRFGNDSLAVGGVGTPEELLEAYAEAGGAPVEAEALRFWEVCGNFKLALVFITQARAYLDGAHRTVELASLGRRTAEAEQELLRLMEESP